MGGRRIAAIALSGALVAGGAGAAMAGVSLDEGKKTEQAILDDAAKRLSVAPEKLREALGAAQDAQLDEAVKAGTLTQKQADAMKSARTKSGRVLGPLGGPGLHGGKRFAPGHGGPGHPRAGFRHGLARELAEALGTTPAKLREQLRSGKSIADVAKANGKSLADVRSALKASVKTRLDEAVAGDDLTREQADRMLAHLDRKLDAIVSGKRLRLHRRGHRGGQPPDLRPGRLMPGEGAPEFEPHGGTFS